MASSTSYSIIANFVDSSGPVDTLTPICTVTLVDGTPVSSGAMTFLSTGNYSYTFAGTVGTQYVWTADSVTLPEPIRYVGNTFKENVTSGEDVRDALLSNPTDGLAPERDSIDYKLRQLILLTNQIAIKMGLDKTSYR